MTDLIHDALPRLVVRYPSCSNCDYEVDLDDGVATCPRCLIQWDGWDEDARPEPDPNVEGADIACGKEPKFPDVKGIRTLPCSLPAAHAERHHHPWVYEPSEDEGDQP